MSKQCDSTFTNASDYHYMQGYQDGIKQGRVDAIGEFAKELHRVMQEEGICFEKEIDKIAEKLKEKR